MLERKSWIDHPAFRTANEAIKDQLRVMAFDFHLAVRDGNQAEAVRLVQEAKLLKRSHLTLIPGGKT